jgi:proline iminopeptidase
MKKLLCVVSLVLLVCFAYGLQQKETSGVINVEGAKLHYIIQGNGIPCLVLGASPLYIRVFSQNLRQNLKFIFLGLRHDAQSENSMEINKITLDTYLNDIEQARSTLGLEKVAVLGHSGHGLIALGYARKYPQHTSHLIMIGTPPVMNEEYSKATEEYWETQASAERKLILKQNSEELTEDELNKMTPMGRFISTYVANAPMYFYNPKYDGSWIFKDHIFNLDVLDHVWGKVLSQNGLDKVHGKISTPVFLALGKYDFVVPYYLWDDAMRGKLSNLSNNLFEKSGHFPMVEERELFDKKLTDWVKSHQLPLSKSRGEK